MAVNYGLDKVRFLQPVRAGSRVRLHSRILGVEEKPGSRILGRAEAYASKQPLGATIINGLGIGAGFTLALLSLGAVREILGAGSLFGIALFGDNFQPWVVMILPPGGFFVLGAWLLIFAWVRQHRQQRLDQEGVPQHDS